MIRIEPGKSRTLRIGELVVTVTVDGLELRSLRRRKRVRVSWNAIALAAIDAEGYQRIDEANALDALTRLASTKKDQPRRLLP
jgi:hypothetical protein